ncbi:proline racemase family protein [Alteribacillus bidgolensis]|uniref:Proline racemase n=1 Tax=Alteribacillus bidgolensis TaxID=930129 RepID=A0A1G8HIF2_9BACI|nr:proline racemase family protein [Alteribacillus bidgolensis]SDI06433.1 proline racemase [Alteribacillus bidgolensis]
MNTKHVFHTIDTHTGGNPTRTILSGVPSLQGKTIEEKMKDMKTNYDWVRKLLMYEPRGHDVMSGAVLLEPCHPSADVGVIYIETGGYLPMCGHDTIGFCTALVETGKVDMTEPCTALTLETPAGLVRVEIKIEDGRAKEVTFNNVPSFFLESIEVEDDEMKKTIACDIAYGGNFYGIIDARSLSLDLTPENSARIIEKAVSFRQKINKEHVIRHPEKPFINGLTHIEFFEPSKHSDVHVKNTVVVPPAGIDRSPCGTGTSAKLATLFAKQEIKKGEIFCHESIVGSVFKGQVLDEINVQGVCAVETQISGSAWITGAHQFFLDPEDPLTEGFLLLPEMEDH